MKELQWTGPLEISIVTVSTYLGPSLPEIFFFRQIQGKAEFGWKACDELTNYL